MILPARVNDYTDRSCFIIKWSELIEVNIFTTVQICDYTLTVVEKYAGHTIEECFAWKSCFLGLLP